MIELVPKITVYPIRCPDDVARIIRVMRERGYRITENNARYIYEQYSESYCAGWLSLTSDDDELVEAILDYSEERPCGEANEDQNTLQLVLNEIEQRIRLRFNPSAYGTPHERYNMGYCDALGELGEWLNDQLGIQ